MIWIFVISLIIENKDMFWYSGFGEVFLIIQI